MKRDLSGKRERDIGMWICLESLFGGNLKLFEEEEGEDSRTEAEPVGDRCGD